MIDKIINRLNKIGSKKKEDIFFITQLNPILSNFKIIFDVGSYEGSFIDNFIRFNSDAKIHCFEPYTKSFEVLKQKYFNNKNIFLNKTAVSDFNGEGILNVNKFLETSSLLESQKVDSIIDDLTEKKNVEKISVIRLNDYCIDNKITNIDLIKIDAQGNSFQVLNGLVNMLESKKISYLYVEAEFVEIYKNEKLFTEIDYFMNKLGYQLIDLYNLNYLSNGNIGWCDILYKYKN